MKTVYRYQKYNVSFFNMCKIVFYKIILFRRRGKRFCKRLLGYTFRSIPVALLVLPLIALLIWYGINNEIYETIAEALWDFKTSIISIIFVPYVTFSTISEINRHRDLKEQRNLYEYFIYESSWFLENIIAILFLGERIFVDLNEESFIDEMNERILNRKPEIKYLTLYFDMYSKTLDNVKARMSSIELIGRIKDYKFDYINDLQNEIIKKSFELKNEKYQSETDYWKKYIHSLYCSINQIYTSMRDPWRFWDKDIDEKIKKCLSDNKQR